MKRIRKTKTKKMEMKKMITKTIDLTKKKKKKRSSLLDLTEELQMEILSRLRAKFVMRCRCVCKPWRKLLADPDFIKLHSTRSLCKPRYHLISGLYPFKTLDLDQSTNGFAETSLLTLKKEHHKYHRRGEDFFSIIGSCDGLVCLSDFEPSVLFYLLNPFTREYIKLPPPLDCNTGGYPLGYGNGAAKTAGYLKGFGYDSVAKKYKLIRIIYVVDWEAEEPSYEFRQAEVCTIGGGAAPSWTTIEPTFPSTPFYINTNPIMLNVNGTLHSLNLALASRSIMAFDISNYRVGAISLPDMILQQWNFLHRDTLCLIEIQGCLGMVAFGVRPRYVQVWMMKTYGLKESWVNIFSQQDTIQLGIATQVLLVMEDGKIMLRMWQSMSQGDKLVIYDSEASTSKAFNFPPPTVIKLRDLWTPYVEALTSIAALVSEETHMAKAT